MKRSLILSVLLISVLFSNTLFAEGKANDPGSIGIGTSIFDFTKMGSDADKTSYKISPFVNYFIIEGLAAGIGLGYSYNKESDSRKFNQSDGTVINFDGTEKCTIFKGGLSVSYYYSLTEILMPYVSASVYFNKSKCTLSDKYQTTAMINDYKTESDVSYFSYSGSVGSLFMITANVAFNLDFTYSYCKYDDFQTKKIMTYNCTAGVQAFIF